jgi:uncharacterized protein DUF2786
MTTRTEKEVRKLLRLSRDRAATKNEAAVALAMAQKLEAKTAKAIAHDIAQLLEARGLIVRVRRRRSGENYHRPRPKVDTEVRYWCSQSHSYHQFEILITEYEQ